ncbi:head GIN domain-containing protein [Chryseobacterium sp. OV279]|uniref:head GIN domain-containing protein n=1 Tax=Chryseobacterium sp. OV279 TaxID=1500285 RepID=UPI00091D824B|nr:head GIN domain-containing protein [Chryseobacterium sp. OV279]SHG61739.1 Putative auto-transporter adhesin, head GIN domain [Chryseobacterium sp. OV279]
MKSTTLFMLSAFALMASCNENHNKRNNDNDNNDNGWVDKVIDKDNGPVKEKTFSGDFDEIEVSQAIDAEVIKSDVEKVVISAPENIINEILVDNDGGKLHIHYKKGIRVMNSHNVKAKIYTKDFSKLTANSAASISIKDKFTQDKISIDISSAASVSGDLEANDFDISAGSSSSYSGKVWAVDLDIEASSAASLDISGKSKNADISSSSGSSVSAKNLIADNVKADASSGASLQVSAVNSVNAEASSGGSVDVSKKGELKNVTKQESSGGSVSIQ